MSLCGCGLVWSKHCRDCVPLVSPVFHLFSFSEVESVATYLLKNKFSVGLFWDIITEQQV